MWRSRILTIFGMALLLSASSAIAAETDLAQSNTSMTGLLRLIHDASEQWAPRLHSYALWLLGCLAVIQLVWTFIPMALRGADLGEILLELFKFIMVIGFFYALLDHSTEWGGAIINSFRQAGAHAAGLDGAELMPGDMFATAVDFSRKVLTAGVSVFSPITSLVVAISALLVLICFTFIAALVFVTLVEAYVIINAAVLFMGFGGSQWTREYALAPIRYAVAVGAKLFVLTLIVGLIMQVSADWSAAYTNDEASLMTLVGLSLVCAYLTKTIPELISGMISGTSMGGGSAIGGMAAAGAAGAATAIATITTAGAAAPAAGALGAANNTASSAAGGLASALNSSIAGGSGTASASGATSGGSSGSTGNSGSGSPTKAEGSRVGGSPSTPLSSSSAIGKPRPIGNAIDTAKQAATPLDDENNKAKNQTAPKGDTASSGGTLAQAVDGATRTLGVLSALAVPGMEGAQSLSLHGAPPAPNASDALDNNAELSVQPESNLIRPSPEASSPQPEIR